MKTRFSDFASISLLLSVFFSVPFLSLEIVASASSRDVENLMSFKNALVNSTTLNDWVPNPGSPCSFTGVTCHQQTRRVSSIDLSSFVLSSDFHTVAAFLLSLDTLETLSLKSANISGPISFPPRSNCSSSLTTLDLSQNLISGPVSGLANLGVCPSLKSLNLSSNSLDFPQKSSGLELRLKSLDLSFNKIVGSNVVPFLLAGDCSDLEFLSLKGNKVSGDMAAISSCNSLRFLDLSANNFSISLPSLGDCSSLEHLDISSNKIYGDLGDAIGNCASLSFINVSNNQFSGGIPAIPTGKLKFLYMGENHFEGGIPLHLLESCPTLVELDLSFNSLSGFFPSAFAACSSLESLDLSLNKFSGKFPIETLLQMPSLRTIDFSCNSFSGGLPDSISKFASLQTLDLSANNLTGHIPNGLCQNPTNNLKQLLLQDNMLTGSVPASLGNCSQLTSLHLSFNYLTGTIPPSLGSLSNLRDLKLWFNQLTGELPPEITKIKTLETLILDFNQLTGSIPDSISNCTQLNWISLSNNRLTGQIPASVGQLPTLAILKLSNNSISGRIPPELGDCKSLIWLDLNSNLLNGTIPPELFKQSGSIEVNFITGKKFAYLKNMKSDECHGEGNLLEYAGIRQGQLGRIATRHPCHFTQVYKGLTQPTFNDNGSMIFLDLSYNMLSGSIPKEIGTMSYLYVLNLGHNRVSGTIPQELGNLEVLNILDLAYNELQGVIPNSMTRLSLLNEIDLSNNKLTGTIPDTGQFETFPESSFANNAGLCGIPLSLCGQTPTRANSQHRKSSRRQASLVGSVAMGLLFSLFCIFTFVVVFVEMKKRREKKDSVLDLYIESRSNSGWKITGTREQLSINLTTFEKPLQKLTFGDLLEATNGFRNDCLIGSGGFGDVYKAELKDGSVVAIKKLIHLSGQGDREFTAEMETIGRIKHRNLVPLLGYCKVGEERLLVYEYMKYGSLEDVLHNPKKSGVTLDWPARRKIAIGAARGLAFLHHNCKPNIIHRDMKSSNVLLDENLEARVSDFGMARLMNADDTHLSVSTLAGTPGYVPPEYYQSFRCWAKGDVYSYGVVLLELLTGKKPTDSDDFGDNNLVGWVKQHAKLKKTDVFDPILLKDDPGLKMELSRHLEVACACLDERPLRRPTMNQVKAMFKEIQVGSGLESQSTIATTEDGGFQMVEMTIKEDPEKQ